MTLGHASTPISVSHAQHHEVDTRLHGRRLLLARIACLTLVVLSLGICIGSLPDYLAQLQTVCRFAPCAIGQLSPELAATLQHLGLSISGYAAGMFAFVMVLALAFFAVGCLIFWRKSDDWMGLLFTYGLSVGGMVFVMLTEGSSRSVWRLPISLVGELLFLSFFLGFSLFPDGRFVPRWTRWLFVTFIVESIIFTFVFNPFTSPLLIAILVILPFFTLYTCLIIAQIYRYRYVSNLVQRQQTKWIVYGLTGNITVFILGFVPILIFPRSLYTLVFTLIYCCTTFLYPFTIGNAILRYRLWDIDVLVNRTLVYGTLTAALALAFAVSILVLQFLLSGLTQGYDLAIVGSTLGTWALSQPLRRRIQAAIDRRFYRRKYDAARTLSAFSATLRNEVDLERLSEDLVVVVEETMQPAFVMLWLRKSEQEKLRGINIER